MKMWETGYKKVKLKSEKKKRKCMSCATEFISTWNGNRVCKICLRSSLWKSGPNSYIQGLNLSDARFQTPANLPSSFKNKKKANEQHSHDERFLLDEEFDN